MSKAVKRLMVENLTHKLDGVGNLVVASTMGMTSEEAVKFRAALRTNEIRALVVKNAMCARALDAVGMGYAGELLVGPSTLIYGGESLVDLAKALVGLLGEFPMIRIIGGAGEGAVLSPADVVALSRLPSRDELVGMIVGGLLSQASGVVGALMAPAQQVVGQIERIADRAEEKEAA